ncbi:uncharacterized protein LOC106357199 [Brassica napus]|uniref:uncharacterized protein LOC106357199 n=1 Tax=Brassica napus TaxID=3708 RepID=UPI0006AA7156|nr:uncharacterized protein LOC106357199 [Brassica napus]
MDKALLALSLKDDDDVPFTLPDLPQYYFSERNACSLIGRLLNPEFQNMANLILDMPRKWQKVNRVRGIALTREIFQFIFTHAHDLQDVLDKGMQTYNDWGLALERWVERPPFGYLQFVSIWVRISNILVNHYTAPAITELGELISHVELVAFDPEKSQRQDYVRVKIRIDVSKPLKKSRTLNLPGGDQTTIFYFYEKVQKRCTHCQRLTHAKPRCPFLVNNPSMQEASASNHHHPQSSKIQPFLSEDDPLFGDLKEDQVGINPFSGRPRIDPAVLQEMRNYLLASSKEDRHVREQRVIFSVKEAEQNPISQKMTLQLLSPLIFTTDIDKGKGIVFDFGKNHYNPKDSVFSPQTPKLMESAIAAGHSLVNSTTNVFCRLELPSNQASSSQIQLSSVPFAGFSSPTLKKEKPKRKPGRYKKIPISQRKTSKSETKKQDSVAVDHGLNKKRKAEDDLAGASKAAKRIASEMVPKEGPSKA